MEAATSNAQSRKWKAGSASPALKNPACVFQRLPKTRARKHVPASIMKGPAMSVPAMINRASPGRISRNGTKAVTIAPSAAKVILPNAVLKRILVKKISVPVTVLKDRASAETATVSSNPGSTEIMTSESSGHALKETRVISNRGPKEAMAIVNSNHVLKGTTAISNRVVSGRARIGRGVHSTGTKVRSKKEDRDDKPYRSRFQDDEQEDRSGLERRVGRYETAPRYNLDNYEHKKKPAARHKEKDESNEIRLNRYIANAGICSRREADDLISSGQISVNGKIITEMGYKVKPTDVVKYGKKALNPEKMVYILINKPKDYITTTDDPEERKTVLDLIAGACSERVYPVGRLDRNTTGLLLLTNDGELAEKLTHPSSGIKKIYQAELDKPITTEDFERLQAGLELEDGFIRPDEVGIVTPDAYVVGLEIHSGRNRIVRRMFEHLGYEVQKLDRTVFAGLNKKDLPRGKWRFLTEKEVIKLKFLL